MTLPDGVILGLLLVGMLCVIYFVANVDNKPCRFCGGETARARWDDVGPRRCKVCRRLQ